MKGRNKDANLACFSDDAVVRDEGERLQGKNAIKDWITKTIAKYKFQFKLLSIKHAPAEIVVAVGYREPWIAAPSHLITTS